MARTVLLNLLGTDNASGAFRSASREVDRTADSVDRLNERNAAAGDSGGRLTSMLGRLAPAAGQAAASILSVSAGLGAAVPAAAGLAAVLVQIAPAAAVAATGIGAAALAMGAFKIGMQGVGEAASAALDPSNPEAYAEALKKLSPNARAFVEEIHKLQPAFASLKTAVQDNLFQGLDKSFAAAAQTTLPIFREGLVGAAQALNGMGRNLLMTINNMGKSGELKGLFDGATAGLKNLTKIPAQLLRGFVQLGAAAAPIFVRMTKGIGDAVTKVSDKLSKAFSSGALSGAIETAVGLLRQLGQVAGNVFKVVQNIFGAANATGGGMIGVLQTITGELAKITGTPAFQQGLQALFGVMNNLATTAAPLLGQALAAIAPVLTALAPAANVLIDALGGALQPIIAALGPVLVAAAEAVGALVIALAPLLPVIGQIIAALLPVLVPVLQLLTTVFTALTPVITIVAQALTTYLVPVITAVVGVVTNVINWFRQLAEQVFPAVAAAVTGAGGPLAGLKQALSDLWAAVQPLATALWDLVQRVFVAIQPAIGPVVAVVTELAGAFTRVLAAAINEVVIPAIEGITALLNGDAAAALQGYSEAVSTATESIVQSMQGLSAKTIPVIIQWGIRLGLAVNGIAGAVKSAFEDMYADVEQIMIKLGLALPGALRAAVGGVKAAAAAIGNGLLAALEFVAPELVWAARNWIKGMTGILRAVVPTMVAIGKSIISGLVAGVNSAAAGLLSRLASIANSIKGVFSGVLQTNSPSKVMIELGTDVMDGLSVGVEKGWKKTEGVLTRVAEDFTEVMVRASGDMATLGRASADFAIISIGDKLAKALTGTAADIDAATKKIAEKIRDAFKAKNISAGERDGLLDYLTSTNKKLKDLSKEREKILEKIKEVQEYAQKLTQSVLNYANFTTIKGDEGAAPNGAQLVAGLQARLATIREFGGNLKKLAAAGLSKALLAQILDAGIDGGAAIANELANGPASIIAALNTAQTQITKIAKGIGIDGADALFGSGKAMGDAFLKGLKSLEKALVDSMEELVEKLVKALGNGVDKAKGKLSEMVNVSEEIAQLANASGDYVAPKKAAAPQAPKPAPPKAAPIYQFISPPKNSGGPRTVSVNMGGVTVKDRADVDMLMNAASFKVRGATF